MLATIGGASELMRAAASALSTSPDPRFPTHYAAGVSLPFPVIMDHEHGAVLYAIFLGFVALLALESAAAANLLGRTGKPAPALLVAGLILVLAEMSFFSVTFSLDAYAYAAFGRLLGIHAVNPYVDHLAGELGDPVLASLSSFLGSPLPDDNYGPLWTWLSAGLAILANPGGLTLAVWMQRAAAACALVVAALGVLRLVRAPSAGERARRTALFALHPLALFESGAAGHNDMLMIAPAVWAFAYVENSAPIAGALIGTAISIKYVAAIVLPFLAITTYRTRGLRGALTLIIPAFVVPVALFAPLWPGWQALGSLLKLGSTPIMSPMWLAIIWLPKLGWSVITAAFVLVFACVLIYSIVRYARDRCGVHIFRSIAALLWSSPLLNPWYVQWLLPASAASGRWSRYAWWFGLLVLVRYIEDALRFPSTQAELTSRIQLLAVATIAILAAPILPAIAGTFRRGPSKDA